MADGTITRREIIEDEALKWGDEYAKNVDKAIEKGNEFVKIILSMAEANAKLKTSGNFPELKENLKKYNDEAEKGLVVWKEQDALEKQMLSTKRKLELATEGTSRALASERIQLQETNKLVKSEERDRLGLVGAYEKLSKARNAAKDNLRNLVATERASNAEIRKAQIEFDRLDGKVRKADLAVKDFTKNVGNYPSVTALTGQLRNLFSAFGLVTGVALFAKALRDGVNVARDFEKQNATLAAVLQVEKGEMKALRDQAKQLGETTVKTAGEVTELQVAYARLGFSQEQILELTESTIQGSIAMNSNLAETAELVGAMVNSFDDFSAVDAPVIVDKLALSTSKSALNFEKLQTALPIVSGAANAAGISFTRLLALLGKLSDAGIDASSSATALRNIFIESAGQGLSYEHVIEKIKNSTDKLTASNDEFGKRGAVSAAVISQNIDKVAELDQTLQGAAGTAEGMAKKELNTLDGAIKLLSSAWQGYIIDTFDANSANGKLQSGLTFIAQNLKTILGIVATAGAVWLTYKAALALARVQQKLLALDMAVTEAAIKKNTAATAAGTAAQTVNTTATNYATFAWERFNAALRKNALLLVVSGLILLVTTLKSYSQSIKEATENTLKTTDAFIKNKEVNDRNAVSIRRLSDRYDQLTEKAKKLGGETKLSRAEQEELDKIINVLAKNVPGAVEAVDKYGDALSINTAKTREYIEAKNELNRLENAQKLQENILLQKKLNREKEGLTINETDLNSKYVEGIGYIRKRNGQLEVYNKITEQGRHLTQQELIDFKKKVVLNEQNLGTVQRNIDILKGLNKAEKEAGQSAAEAAKEKEASGPRTIAIIDEEIKALQDSISLLSDKTGKEGDAIKAKIAALKAERELIYSTDKADKKSSKDRVKRIKEIRDAMFNLEDGRLSRAIETNNEIVEDEKRTWEERTEALFDNEQLQAAQIDLRAKRELENLALSNDKIKEYSQKQLDTYIKQTDDRIAQILRGEIEFEKLTNAEVEIVEGAEFKKSQARLNASKTQQQINDSAFDEFRKKIEQEAQEILDASNNTIAAENNKFLELNKIESQNSKQRESAVKEHERKIYEIKLDAAKKQLEIQIENAERILELENKKLVQEQASVDKIKKLEKELAEYRLELSQLVFDDYEEKSDKRAETEKETAEKIRDIQERLLSSLTDLFNALSDARISAIDAEIAKNEEYYSRQIELAGNDQRQKELLSKEAEKKRDELEKKKRKEQHKQAVLNKRMAEAQGAINLALAVTAALTTTPPASFVLAAITAALAGVELAAIIATPIPNAYKEGRTDGPAEKAIVGDGGKTEVISRQDGSNPRMTPARPTLVDLKAGDRVHRSVEEYKEFMRRSMMESVITDGRQASEALSMMVFNTDNRDLIEEMKLTRKAIEKIKMPRPVISKMPDISHLAWSAQNKNWRA